MATRQRIIRRTYKVTSVRVKKIEGIDPWRAEFLILELAINNHRHLPITLHVKSFKSPKGKRHIIPFMGYDPRNPTLRGHGHCNTKTNEYVWVM
jgi:hypothetical protein